MPLLIPGNNDRLRNRIQRARQARPEQDTAAGRKIARAVARMAEAEEIRKLAERSAFDFYLMTGENLFDMEDTIRNKAPKTPDEEWDPEFIDALTHIEEAKDMAEHALIDCIGKENGT